MDFGDLVQVREAAQRFLTKSLDAGVRVAIFTASGKPLLEFTNDREKLRGAIAQLHFDARFAIRECPRLPAYFAQMVLDDVATSSLPKGTSRASSSSAASDPGADPVTAINQDDPIKLAEVIAGRQRCPADPGNPDADIQSRARNAIFQNHLGVEVTLTALGNLVQRMAQTPGGERTIAMLSSGFFDRNSQYKLDQLIDRALRSNVVVNTLDARGLVAEESFADLAEVALTPEIQVRIDEMNHRAMKIAADPLSEVAQGTGGVFVENSNDMEGGLAKISEIQAPEYVLGFSPENLKEDGKFHSLHVKLLASGHFTLQARRGYFGPQKAGPAGDAEREKMESALFTQDQISGLPIHVRTASSKAGENSATLSVTVDADMQSVRFLKQDGRNSDDITLTVVVFDSDGNYITARQQTTKLRLTDVALQNLRRGGGETSVDLTLPTGTYLVRAVLGESASSQVGAASQSVRIP